MDIVRIGLDLAKNIFQVHGVSSDEKVVLRGTLRRDAVRPEPLLLALLSRHGVPQDVHYWSWTLSAAVPLRQSGRTGRIRFGLRRTEVEPCCRRYSTS